ncbi:MFS transporter, partial [Halomonas sp. MG34]|nr:MFS transporter [Halomonas sp. MG34]
RRPSGNQLDEQHSVKVKILEKRVLFPAMLILLVGVAAGGIMSFFSLYSIEKDFTHVGLFFLLIAVASFAIRLISGKLFDVHGPSVIVIPGSILSMIGFFILFFAGSDSMFMLAALLYGFGFGAIFPAIQTWCMNLVEEHEHENAMASFFNFFDLGIGGGSVILGLVATAASYQAIYLVASIVYGVLLVVYIVYLAKRAKGKMTKRKQTTNLL